MALARQTSPATAAQVASLFTGRGAAKRVEEILEMLAMLGQANVGEDGRYVGM